VNQPHAIRVVCVPDAEQLACPCFVRNQFDPLLVSITKHELERVDMPPNSLPNGRPPDPIERGTSLRDILVSSAPPHFTGKTAVRRPNS
jgi:hypothetical protein